MSYSKYQDLFLIKIQTIIQKEDHLILLQAIRQVYQLTFLF